MLNTLLYSEKPLCFYTRTSITTTANVIYEAELGEGIQSMHWLPTDRRIEHSYQIVAYHLHIENNDTLTMCGLADRLFLI